MTIVSPGPSFSPKDGGRISEVAHALEAMRRDRPPFIIGITGSVAAGKSAFAAALASAFSTHAGRSSVEIASTDGFLLANQILDGRGLTLRKGYPESFDVVAFGEALRLARVGPVTFPGYSHATYDVDPRLDHRIDSPAVLIVEGLGLGPHRDAIDALIYLDADEADLEAWFIARFLRLWEDAEHDAASFYARFRGLDRAGAGQLAKSVWTSINLPNLREHISPQRDLADLVVRKGPDHEIVGVLERHGQAARL